MKHATSTSELRDLRCQTRWLIKRGLRFRDDDRRRPPSLGNAVHEGLSTGWGHYFTLGEVVPGAIQGVREWATTRREKASVSELVVLDDVEPTACELMAPYFRRWPHLADLDAGWRPVEMLMNEDFVEHRTQTPSGNLSPVSWMQGRVDKLARDSRNQLWLVEHKVLMHGGLDRWVETHEYQPQRLTYGWLVEDILGERPAGIVFDLIDARLPPPASAYKLAKAKGGRVRLSKQLPAGATMEGMLEAIELHRHPVKGSGDGYGTQGFILEGWEYNKARTLPTWGHRFRREYLRFAPGELERARKEAWVLATQARRLANRTEAIRYRIQRLLELGKHSLVVRESNDSTPQGVGFFDEEAREVAVEYLQDQGHLFPRNQGECWSWSRRCPYMDLCRERTVESSYSLNLKLEEDR